MAYDPGAIDATLAAVVGDDPGLIAELREAFLDGAKRGVAAVEAAGADPAAWSAALARLKGLAASFGAVRLVALAIEVTDAVPGDEATVRKLKRVVARL